MKDYGFRVSLDFSAYVYVSDSKEHCLQGLVKFLQKEGVKIYGLTRTAKGNYHDESWHTIYTFIKDENPFQELIERLKLEDSSTYECAPTFMLIDELSEEEISKWSEEYDTGNREEEYRNLYAEYCNEPYIARIQQRYPKMLGTGKKNERVSEVIVAGIYFRPYDENDIKG